MRAAARGALILIASIAIISIWMELQPELPTLHSERMQENAEIYMMDSIWLKNIRIFSVSPQYDLRHEERHLQKWCRPAT